MKGAGGRRIEPSRHGQSYDPAGTWCELDNYRGVVGTRSSRVSNFQLRLRTKGESSVTFFFFFLQGLKKLGPRPLPSPSSIQQPSARQEVILFALVRCSISTRCCGYNAGEGVAAEFLFRFIRSIKGLQTD